MQLEFNMRQTALIGYSTGTCRLMKFSEGIRELKSDHEAECLIDYVQDEPINVHGKKLALKTKA